MKRDLISIDDQSLKNINDYISFAEKVEMIPPAEKTRMLFGKILGVLFFEPSTRTRLSFEAAMLRLGGQIIGFSDVITTSTAKGESLADTIKTVEQYCDAVVIRHPREGAARLSAEVSRLPVINAGDGSNQHPTQTLLDLFTIKKFFGRIENLKIALAGDLKYSRTVHSLVHALVKYSNIEFTLVTPETLKLPDYVKNSVDKKAFKYSETTDLKEAITKCDIVYMTRIQRERFPDPVEYEKVKDSYRIDNSILKDAQPHLKILHPLPRVNEISPEVDSTPFAGYFPQVGYGLTMRQAILLNHIGGQE
ncbi:MAG: aspartate carbamoyltransferase [Candidatus Riflebacteria bacterium]|nr:aspartate carbamoyltransferase [Candidatus Riflebacteria bacterium]